MNFNCEPPATSGRGCFSGFLHFFFPESDQEKLSNTTFHKELSELPRKADLLLRKITQLESESPSDGALREVAAKVDRLLLPLLHVSQRARQSETPECDASLYAAYLLAKTLKSMHPVKQRIWHQLKPPTQGYLNKIAPFPSPPVAGKEDLALNFCATHHLTSAERKAISFGDLSLFQAVFLKQERGILTFTLPLNPEAILAATGPLPAEDLEECEHYLERLPLKFLEEPAVKKLLQEISDYDLYPAIGKKRVPQLKHQLLVLKREYQNKLLEALGIPVERPNELGTHGEWTVQSSTPASFVRELSESEQFPQCAAQIRRLFQMERKYGISLFREALSKDQSGDFFAIRDGKVFSPHHKQSLSFISEDFGERHQSIMAALKQIYPDELYGQIFPEGWLNEQPDHGREIKELQRLAALEQLAFADFCSCSEKALIVLRTARHCTLTLNIDSKPAELENSIYRKAYELITAIPGIHNPLKKGETLQMAMEKDERLRSELDSLLLHYLFLHLCRTPQNEISFTNTLEHLIAITGDKLIHEAKTDRALQIPRVVHVDYTKEAAVYQLDEKLIDPAAELFALYWTHFIAFFNERVLLEDPEETTADMLILLRAAALHYPETDKQEAIQKSMDEILHKHMLKKEISLKASKLKMHLLHA